MKRNTRFQGWVRRRAKYSGHGLAASGLANQSPPSKDLDRVLSRSAPEGNFAIALGRSRLHPAQTSQLGKARAAWLGLRTLGQHPLRRGARTAPSAVLATSPRPHAAAALRKLFRRLPWPRFLPGAGKKPVFEPNLKGGRSPGAAASRRRRRPNRDFKDGCDGKLSRTPAHVCELGSSLYWPLAHSSCAYFFSENEVPPTKSEAAIRKCFLLFEREKIESRICRFFLARSLDGGHGMESNCRR